MRLETQDGRRIDNPDERQIDEAIRAMEADDAFVILSRDEMTYIQASGDVSAGFVLEYQAGDIDRHFSAAAGPHSADRVSKAFRQYALGDPGWESDFQWEPLEI